jgi:hypothetical protein
MIKTHGQQSWIENAWVYSKNPVRIMADGKAKTYWDRFVLFIEVEGFLPSTVRDGEDRTIKPLLWWLPTDGVDTTFRQEIRSLDPNQYFVIKIGERLWTIENVEGEVTFRDEESNVIPFAYEPDYNPPMDTVPVGRDRPNLLARLRKGIDAFWEAMSRRDTEA